MFTYLFGAGASAKSIPLANTLLHSLIDFKDNLSQSNVDDWKIQLNDQNAFHAEFIVKELIQNLNEIIQEAGNHETVDTYAKMLYLTNDTVKYSNLKIALSSYFYWIQYRTQSDNRYDHFLASIIEDPDDLANQFIIPKNIKILTWNYDMQLEMALSKYLPKCKKCNDILSRANILKSFDTNYETYSVIKINGCCLIERKNEDSPIEVPYFDSLAYDLQSIEASLRVFYLLSKLDYRSLLNFAWENKDKFQYLNSSKYPSGRTLSDTEYLIVIGYSFPFFNRHFDRTFLKKMTKLKKIYVQSEPNHVDSLISKIQSFDVFPESVKYIPVKDTTQFYLPPEL